MSIRTTTNGNRSTGLLRLPEGVHDWSTIDTTPGAVGVLAAPPKTVLAPVQYQTLIRNRYARDPAARQHLLCLALRLQGGPHSAPIKILGPHADTARDILTSIKRKMEM